MSKDRMILAGLVCCAPFALVWLLYRELQWSGTRRPPFRGRYEQPVDAWGDGGRVPEWDR